MALKFETLLEVEDFGLDVGLNVDLLLLVDISVANLSLDCFQSNVAVRAP